MYDAGLGPKPLAGGPSGKTMEVPHGPGCLQQQAPGCIDQLKVTQICPLLYWLRMILMSGSMSESTLVKVSSVRVCP